MFNYLAPAEVTKKNPLNRSKKQQAPQEREKMSVQRGGLMRGLSEPESCRGPGRSYLIHLEV